MKKKFIEEWFLTVWEPEDSILLTANCRQPVFGGNSNAILMKETLQLCSTKIIGDLPLQLKKSLMARISMRAFALTPVRWESTCCKGPWQQPETIELSPSSSFTKRATFSCSKIWRRKFRVSFQIKTDLTRDHLERQVSKPKIECFVCIFYEYEIIS